MYVGSAITGWWAAHDWNWHLGSLRHLGVWIVTFLGRRLGLVVERSNFGPDEINVGHRTWPGSIAAEALRVEPIWIEVSIEVVWSLSSFEAEENDQDESEDANGTSDDTPRDSAHV